MRVLPCFHTSSMLEYFLYQQQLEVFFKFLPMIISCEYVGENVFIVPDC